MPNTPRSTATSELGTQVDSQPSTPTSVSAASASAAAAAKTLESTTEKKEQSKQPKILVSEAGVFASRETHWAFTTWLAKGTSAAKLETAFNQRANILLSSSDSGDSSNNSSRNQSPSTGPRS